jgi:hypothetical protein
MCESKFLGKSALITTDLGTRILTKNGPRTNALARSSENIWFISNLG